MYHLVMDWKELFDLRNPPKEVHYFGRVKLWPGHMRIAATPEADCAWCKEPIVYGEDGFILPAILEDGPSWVAYHRACHLRQIFGSLAHAQRKCSCYVPGSTCTDPPEMTRREAAEAVVEYMEWA
jgi:hypothetical protein